MKTKALGLIALAAVVVGASMSVSAQGDAGKSQTPAAGNGATAVVRITAASTPVELARAAVAAQGGEKFKNVKNIILKGSVDLYPPNSTQAILGGFVSVIAGDKARLEIDARPAVTFKQIYDGQRSYISLPNVDVPPASKFGMSLLVKFDQPGYVVSAIPDKKNQRGFRVSDADGNATDFYVDPGTGRVMSFVIPYAGYTFGIENKKMKEVDGVLIATSYSQRFEMPQGVFFADYTVKDIKLNQELGDDVFLIP